MSSNIKAINPISHIFKKNNTNISNIPTIIDDVSYANLMQEHKVYLYKIAYSYVKNEQVALDIIQDTTYKGLINISNLKDKSYFKTWITRVLINTSIDYLKKNKNTILLDDDIIELESSSKNNNPNNNFSNNLDENIDLYNAIDNLKENHKTVIILKYFNDMTEKEISQVMQIPVNTVKSHLRRAKSELKNCLKF